MNYSQRIGKDYLRADWQDGEIIQHTDLNELETVVKAAINANYEDIQKIVDGTYTVESASNISGTTLSKYADETLQNTDDKVPSSLQVKAYVDAAKQEAIAAIPDDISAFNNDVGYITNATEGLNNYYKKSETYTQAETQAYVKAVNNLDNYYKKTETYTKTETNAYVKAVNDLDNYYKKSETYTKTETQNLVNSLIKVTIQVVETLPTTGQANVIYFVPKLHTEYNNVYDEFVWINNAWENIGDTELDNLDISATKSGHTATITVTKRNGTQESVEVYDGITPDTQIGTVQTLAAGSNAVVTRTGTDAQPVLNFGIPRGDTGFSPTATVTQNPNTFLTTITITDVNGTTTATIDCAGISAYLDDCLDDLETLTTMDTTQLENLTEVD